MTTLVPMRALVGIQGTRLREGEREKLQRHRFCGVLLLRHNVVSAAQLEELCAEIQEVARECCGRDALIAVDEEGGAVSPLAPAIGYSLSAAALGLVDDLVLTEKVHQWRASSARALGVGLVLAPVADVDRIGNPVIATRSFGRDAELVARHVRAAMRGLRAGGVAHCVKHWPGHGPVRVDSHYALPTLEVDRTEWERCDRRPFEASLFDTPDAMMVAHVIAPFLDDTGVPATISRAIVHEWLRERWGFEGVILSDALEMGGFEGRSPAAALDAGCDLLLLATPMECLRIEVLDDLAVAREDDEAVVRRLELLLSSSCDPPCPVPEGFDPRWDRRACISRGRSSGRRGTLRWALVDAASQDRLLRPPVGFDVLHGASGEPTASLLRPQFETAWSGRPADELCLDSSQEVPAVEPETFGDVEWLVVGAVRPLTAGLMNWLDRWAAAHPKASVVGLGAVALDLQKGGELGRLIDAPDRRVVLCPDLHDEACVGVARRISRGSS